MPAVLIGLVKCHVPPVRRKARICELPDTASSADLFSAAVEPYQLRLVCPPSRLYQQCFRPRHTKKSQIDLRQVLHLIVDDSGFAAQHVIASVELLGHQSFVSQVQ